MNAANIVISISKKYVAAKCARVDKSDDGSGCNNSNDHSSVGSDCGDHGSPSTSNDESHDSSGVNSGGTTNDSSGSSGGNGSSGSSCSRSSDSGESSNDSSSSSNSEHYNSGSKENEEDVNKLVQSNKIAYYQYSFDTSADKSTFATIAQSVWSVKIKNDRSSIRLKVQIKQFGFQQF